MVVPLRVRRVVVPEHGPRRRRNVGRDRERVVPLRHAPGGPHVRRPPRRLVQRARLGPRGRAGLQPPRRERAPAGHGRQRRRGPDHLPGTAGGPLRVRPERGVRVGTHGTGDGRVLELPGLAHRRERLRRRERGGVGPAAEEAVVPHPRGGPGGPLRGRLEPRGGAAPRDGEQRRCQPRREAVGPARVHVGAAGDHVRPRSGGPQRRVVSRRRGAGAQLREGRAVAAVGPLHHAAHLRHS
mmetsp:Transcript_46903/g.91563  ORF Transcript_46903/g.91563 Transcript_46903/m.91563 type:complete len:240 (+) Transcript_46903:279-998(+)